MLHSMALPLMSKTLKTPILKSNILGYASSLENVSFNNSYKQTNSEEWTLPRKLSNCKKPFGESYYSGSLDTAIWSKKFKPIQASSYNVQKNKMLERFLEFSNEEDSTDLKISSQKDLYRSDSKENCLRIDNSRVSEKNLHLREGLDKKERERKCKVHNEKINRDSSVDFLYGIVERNKRLTTKTFSDNELDKVEHVQNFDRVKFENRDESPFERIKNALSRTAKDKIFKPKPEGQKIASTKKRKPSFLKKVFKKKDIDNQEITEFVFSESTCNVVDSLSQNQGSIDEVKEETKEEIQSGGENMLHTEVRKTITGSKSFLPDSNTYELKMRSKSRELLITPEPTVLSSDEDTNSDAKNHSTCNSSIVLAPSLPPRRVSRPISPWHDIPTNNTPINSNQKSFFSHQALVKFKDSIVLEEPTTNDPDGESIQSNLIEFQSDSADKSKNDDLSLLLEQLTKITVAPLAEPELMDDSRSYSSDSEKFCGKSEYPEPDYDVPRPHKRLSISISSPGEVISSTNFLGRCNDCSEKSFQSIEPDSLEAFDKTILP